MRIRLADDRRARLLRSMRAFFEDELELDLGDLRSARILDFFVRELGPPVYNQAIQDARAFVHEKLDLLEAEFFEPDEPSSR
jgi:uncharacterized protein (DUF2164 family)